MALTSRDPNVAIDGVVYGLTVLSAVMPGFERALRASLAKLNGRGSPFARVDGTHFARLVLIDALPYEGPLAIQPVVTHEHLLFSAVFDGETTAARDAYLEAMCVRIPTVVNRLWGRCLGAPSPPARYPGVFASWMAQNQIETRAFFAQSPHARVADVRSATVLWERVRRFAIHSQYVTPGALRAAFRKEFG